LDYEYSPPRIEGRQRRGGWLYLVIAAVVLLFGSRILAGLVIDYQWWQEMHQMETWLYLLLYETVPVAVVSVLAFVIFFVAHARGMKHARVALRDYRRYALLSTLVVILAAIFVASATVDSNAVVRYFGGRAVGGAAVKWSDPEFGNPLAFYLFQLPFYSVLLRVVLALSVLAAILYWGTARAWELATSLPDLRNVRSIELSDLRLRGALESWFLRGLGAVFLVALAVRFFLSRYDFLLAQHGFMVGLDYVDKYVSLPLQWLLIVACLLSAVGLLLGKWKVVLLLAAGLILRAFVPAVVSAAYVRPNEISLERPFIQRHIEATRNAYGVEERMSEMEFHAKAEQTIDIAANKPLLDNVRLWDWSAFHQTLSQIQPLRPYTYSATDVDRYVIDGQYRQVLLAARELDQEQLGDARQRWINPHFIYTHGYGIVMAESNQITANGLPVLFVKDAPPVITAPGLKFTRPQIYYGEQTADPVFVRTAQPEFDYPAGEHNVQTRYDGNGGFPISNIAMRGAAAVSRGDWNILLTGYLTPESRMMIHRHIIDRVNTLADFVLWDPDPYLVLKDDGRLAWIIDGYMTSDAHPYSQDTNVEGYGSINYVRNSVKATVDAYDGSVHLYVFDENDPLMQAYRNLFPQLFAPAANMPADLRRHARYPELFFRMQSNVYRLFHMRDPDTFYNKSDAWDIANFTTSQEGKPEQSAPNYVVATLPGEQKPEFLLMIPFTPRGRDNLIGLMMARCDGEHLGEKVVLQLSKQELLLGPMQVEARINQDQTISKDLTLWNQQGSRVLRGQMLVLPIQQTFLYVEPIYLQAAQAKMPQLKKIALAVGNTLIYTDSYEQALAQLAGQQPQASAPVTAVSSAAVVATAPGPAPDARIVEIRRHLERYRDLVSQGKLSEAGKELEAVQTLVGK
jgi:uncharacterized membrane protein (UPF0182 family)